MLRDDHTIFDDRQEHVDNHNIIEPLVKKLMGELPKVRRWFDTGPPGVVIGASPGDEYVDTETGDIYVLQ